MHGDKMWDRCLCLCLPAAYEHMNTFLISFWCQDEDLQDLHFPAGGNALCVARKKKNGIKRK